MFDIMAALWPRPCLVARMIWPEKHRLNMWLCYTGMVLAIVGTVDETIVAMYLYGINFAGWPSAAQWTTPISHVLFVIGQGSSSKIMFALGRKHRKQLKQLRVAEEDAESAANSEEDSFTERV
ncbi:uncharacterized protein M421DRAFT_94482 [Didymella exigua CBS 183.55]|uniref:Uncharacterized protein n=1 Tax=Didymella exigua CBS 183.55 TaxID=1150837 RepID=A0A6A5RDW2_9PLEO|nr:uncharacterized protein M421DRAFT_94482 [Didymella exigua CBS 183.55]KAF1925862.1 hypothetical protein M421DRAFT_94482 [Didymella exigua CBS 183.55]